jgi:seryl-tRNA synthetase
VLDIKLIRRRPDEVRTALARRDPGLVEVVEEILQLDQRWRAATSTAENLRAEQRGDSENIAAGKKAGEDVSALLAGMKELSARVKELTEQAGLARERLDALLLRLPNLPDPTAAPGPEDELVRTVGEIGVTGSGVAGPGVAGSGMGSEAAGSEVAGPGVAGSEVAGSGVTGSGVAGPGVAGSEVAGSGVTGSGVAGPGVAGSGMGSEAAGSEVAEVDGSRDAGAKFKPRDHLELAGAMIDMDHAAVLSGARFAYLKGDLVLLELALVRWVLEKLRGYGFEPVIPPVLVRERALFGTGFLPDTEQQIYALPADELYLVGTSEVALASLHDEEIIDADRLPLRYAGFSPCFRREAGAAGKDTRGIFRVHQFDKVEMFSFVEPADSGSEHERILGIEEEILSELGLPYRVLNIAVGDLGNSAAKKYDCEAWLLSQGRYRELTSCSNTTDYQARRLNIRVRREKRGGRGAGGRELETLHTLNGTAVAVGRTLIALLENGQREDGSVVLPACLAPFGAPAELPAAG